jgi:hypothetical protein
VRGSPAVTEREGRERHGKQRQRAGGRSELAAAAQLRSSRCAPRGDRVGRLEHGGGV